MIELIENTLQVISKISSSKCGYLLKVSGDGFKVLTMWGGKPEEFDLVNDYLFNLKKTNELDCNSVNLDNLLKNNSLNSYFLKDLILDNEKNQAVYILLFAEDTNKYENESVNNVVSVLPILSRQVKKLLKQDDFENTQQNILINKSGEDLDGNGLLNNWEQNFNNLIETSPDLVFILDGEGKFLLVNKSGLEFLEYSANNLKGKHFTEFVDPENQTKVSNLFNEALIKKTAVTFDVSLLSKYENTILMQISCRIIEKDNKVIGMIGIGRNLGKQKNIEVELNKIKPKILEANRLIKIERTRAQQKKSLIEELNRLKQDFVSNISHEFRTPLASIIGFSETIESDPDLPPEMKKEFNNVILNEGKRLAKLINNILNLSKFEGSGIILKRDNFDIVKLLNEVEETNKDFAEQKNITLIFESPHEEVVLEADNERLYQAINALVNNAIKFTDDFGRVKIIVNDLFREVEIIISDTGLGIPEKDLSYIFQRFYRVSRPGSDIPGTGVGLVFVKQIVDLHKGLITVQSDVGSGTTFMVKLPKSSKIENN
ncbi:MAG: PAS domain-containing sensor histidine kinase [Ignavibacteria bacterium]|nr:PAS domain-containing sensor histidine kinase [Ignavibacteria bacterium]MBT8381972.1 PAS domain-containing sensor histidine kinase [Ignavibacteria bacterium]NNJ53399.1 PAS domain-containing sensor histidine kinase [Ignavibacteriaceae bacterium]